MCCGSHTQQSKQCLKALIALDTLWLHSWHVVNWAFCSNTDYIKRYATDEVLRQSEEDSSSSASEMSDLSDDEIQDMEL